MERDVRALHLVAVGKAAAPMMAACLSLPRALPVRRALAIGTHQTEALGPEVTWYASSHPVPDARSVEAAARVLAVAGQVATNEGLLLLLSGGASALMAAPCEGLSLEDKQATVRRLLAEGAPIHALNTVRKHLSVIKGGRLAAACRGQVRTLAISDVVGDDLSVIGSGPGVPDASTWADVSHWLETLGGLSAYPATVQALVRRGVAGEVAETPKPGGPEAARAIARVIGGRHEAMAAAAAAAAARGYTVVVQDAPVTGEARETAQRWWQAMDAPARPPRCCVLSSGETTVRVHGDGRGGRNQEFALALARPLAACRRSVVAASVGTDGIDGPTDAAGGWTDGDTLRRAAAVGLGTPEEALARNDAYPFLSAVDELIITGPTGTNVGDLQVLLIA